MSTNRNSKSRTSRSIFEKFSASLTLLLFLASTNLTTAALANNQGGHNAFQQFALNNPGLETKELKQLFHQEIRELKQANNIQNAINNVQSHQGVIQNNVQQQLNKNDFASKAEFQAAKQALNLQNRNLHDTINQTVQQAANNQIIKGQGFALDLGSAVESITLGDKLFRVQDSVVINVGGQEKTLGAGAKVTAAEYVAARQALNTGHQTVTLDNSGRATGGVVDLDAMTDGNKTMKVTDLVVPVSVTASGDFSKQGDIRIKGDLVNNGSINAFASGNNSVNAMINADNITNNAGAAINSSVHELTLVAEKTFNNYGTINATENLTVAAGKSLTNTGSITAQQHLNVFAPQVTNSGHIASAQADVTFDAIASTMNINNNSGTVSALNGAINIREAGYNESFDTQFNGGDLLSKEVNLNAGNGTANLNVGELTGKVNASGLAAHVQAETDNLVIGKQCLIGDPTYYNTGNIVLDGSIEVGEALAIIAGGSIIATSNVDVISARQNGGHSFDITMVAGANITSSGTQTPNPLPEQFPITGNSNLPVTINPVGAPGGDIDLSGAASNLRIDTRAGGSGFNGGNVTLVAFANGATGGRVILPAFSNIQTGGVGGGGNGGNVTVIAGGASGNNSVLGSIDTSSTNANNYSGTGGSVSIFNAQPSTSNGGNITFLPDGTISTGNSFVASPTLAAGNMKVGEIFTDGGNLTIKTGGVLNFAGSSSSSLVNTSEDLNGGANNGSIDLKAASIYISFSNGVNMFAGQSSDDTGFVNIETTSGGITGVANSGGLLIGGGDHIDLNLAGDIILTDTAQVYLFANNYIHADGFNIDVSRNLSSGSAGLIYMESKEITAGNLTANNTFDGNASFIQLAQTHEEGGSLTVGNLQARATGTTGNGGAMIISMVGGNAQIGQLVDTSSVNGNGGDVSIRSEGTVPFQVKVGSIKTDAGSGKTNGKIQVLASDIVFDAPTTVLSANGAGSITSSKTITLTATVGGISTGGNNLIINSKTLALITTSNHLIDLSGNTAGSLNIFAEQGVAALGNAINTSCLNIAGGNAGSITLQSGSNGYVRTGSLTANAAGNGNGGDILINAESDLNIGIIKTNANGATGTAGLVSITCMKAGAPNSGSVSFGSIEAKSSTGGNGNNVTIVTDSNLGISVPSIDTSGVVGGNISITSQELGSSNQLFGNLNSSGSGGKAGNITFDGSTGAIVSINTPINFIAEAASGFANGNISISGRYIVFGAGSPAVFDANGAAGSTGGNVTLNASGSTGILSSSAPLTINAGGNINITSGSNVLDMTGGAPGTASVNFTAGGSINAGGVDILTSSPTAGLNGGNVTLVSGAAGGVTVGNITANGGSTSGSGGDVFISAGTGGITVGVISNNGAGTGNGGDITLHSLQTSALTLGTLSPTGVLKGDVDVSTGGVLNVNLVSGAVVNLVSTGGNISLLNNVTGSTSIKVSTNQLITQGASKKLIGGALTLEYATGSGTQTFLTNVTSLAVNAPGRTLVIGEDNGIRLDSANCAQLTIQGGSLGTGDVTTGADISFGGILFLQDFAFTGNIALGHNISVASLAILSNNTLSQTLGTKVTASSTIDLNVATGTSTLKTATNSLRAVGGASYIINEDDGIDLMNIGITGSGALTVNAGIVGAGNITTSQDVSVGGNLILDNNNGGIALSHNVSAANVTLDVLSGSTITQTATKKITAGLLTVNTVGSSTSLNTNVAQLTSSLGSGSLTITEDDGIQLNTQVGSSLSVIAGQSAAGDITTGAGFTVGSLTLQTAAGGDVVLNHNITANTQVQVTTAGGDIIQTAGVLNSSNFVLSTSGGDIIHQGGGAFSISNASAINLGAQAGTGVVNISALVTSNVTLNASSGSDFTLSSNSPIAIAANLTVTGVLSLTTNDLTNAFALKGTVINIQSNAGNALTLDGGAGGTLEATSGLISVTAASGALTLEGSTEYKTAAKLSASSVVLAAGSNSKADVASAIYAGSITGGGALETYNVPGATWTLVNSGTYANNPGDITLGNITFIGSDIAIIAAGNIIITGNISLSGTTGGDLTMIAGYSSSLVTGGTTQFDTSATPINTFTPTAGGSITVTGSIDTSGSAGNGGNVLAIANNGSISLGNIDASAIGANTAGNVKIIASGNITTGDISAASLHSGSIELTTGTPSIPTGTGFQIISGVANGVVTASALTNGTITVNGIISGGDKPIALITGNVGSITYAGTGIDGQNFTFKTGALAFTQLNTIAAAFDINSDGGTINITANSVTTSGGPLHLDVRAANPGTGGTINVTMNTASTLNLNNTTGQFFFDIGNPSSQPGSGGTLNFTNIGAGNIILGAGAVTGTALANSANVKIQAAGDITVGSASAFNLSGADGKGAVIELDAGTDGSGVLALGANTGFFSQANGTGLNGAGGGLILTGSNITYTAGTSAANALALTATGIGSGAGGQIVYKTNDLAPTFIGNQARAPRAPFHFITANASGGSSGDGGSLDIEVGGNLTISNTGLALATRGSSGVLKGGSYTFKAGTNLAATRGGALLINGAGINGNINSDGLGGGDAGSITLLSRSSTAFTLHPLTAPRGNGVFGTLSANGTNGQILINNSLGGVLVSASNSLLAPEISLIAGGSRGTIKTVAGVIISAASKLTLAASSDIGSRTLMLVNTPDLEADSSLGVVGISNQFLGTTTLRNSSSGKTFTLNTKNDTNLNLITAANGTITITETAGTLTLQNNLTATGGGINLLNGSATGNITVNDSVQVQTLGRGKAVIMQIGSTIVPRAGTNPVAPGVFVPNMTTQIDSTRNFIFLGPGGNTGKIFVPVGTAAFAHSKNVNIIFNNLGSTGLITLGNGSLIFADPPAPANNPVVAAAVPVVDSKATIANLTQLFGFATENATFTSDLSVLNLNAAPQLQAATNATLMTATNASMVAGDVASNAACNAALQTAERSGALNAASNAGGTSANDEDNSYAVGYCPATGFSDGAICSDSEIVDSQIVGRANIQTIQHNERVVIKKGNVLFVPFKATTVETPNGIVHIDAKSVALVSSTEAGLAVYDLEDQHKGSVSVESNGHNVVLSPGRHVMITPHHGAEFAQINAVETIAHRNVQSVMKNGHRAHTSEFSVLSAIDTVKPLTAMVLSKNAHAKQIADRMMKTTAIILQIGGAAGQYQHYFKPRMTAMQK